MNTSEVKNPPVAPVEAAPYGPPHIAPGDETTNLRQVPSIENLTKRLGYWGKTPELAARLIWEEMRFRQDQGEAVSLDELISRFPEYAEELQRLARTAADGERFVPPMAGEQIAGYELTVPLGRGVQGQVFLARQLALAGRPVVLKFTACYGSEHLNLARLQHTYIVPLFGVEEVPERNLRLLCMPFLGGVALSELLIRLDKPAVQRTGLDIRNALEEMQRPYAADLPGVSNAGDTLGKMSYVDFVCRLGCCLAEALEYAHQHGLVHLDIKPSNILLAPDGRPLLLDFHLARTPLTGKETRLLEFGGTWRYMSPEQCGAVTAVSMGAPIPGPVDQRSDIYSLALVLFDALGGERNSREQPLPATLRSRNPEISVGLADILAKCLAEDPAQRYASAGLLADVLRRHLEDRPLRGAPNRSWRETWRKWRRRRPLALPTYGLLAFALAALCASPAVLVSEYQSRHLEATRAMAEGQELLRKERFLEAATAFGRAEQWLAPLPLEQHLRKALAEHQRLAQAMNRAQDLHKTVNSLRFQALIDPLPRRSLMVSQLLAERLWRERAEFLAQNDLPLEVSVKERIRADLLDLALLRAEVHVRLAPAAEKTAATQVALRMYDEARTTLGSSPALLMELRRSADELGLKKLRDDLDQAIAEQPAQRPWDLIFVGRAYLRAGEYAAAEEVLRRAHQQQPLQFLPNYYLGFCAQRQGRHAESVSAFSFCLGQEPRAEVFYMRGLAHAAMGLDADAQVDFDHAIKHDSYLGPAYFNRGQIHAKHAREAAALDDFAQAAAHGHDQTAVHLAQARVFIRQRDFTAARDRLDLVLQDDPDNNDARRLLEEIPQSKKQ